MRSPTPEKAPAEKHPRGDHNRFLYLQLQHIERKLELLGPLQFQNPQSYIHAVSQVQHMKEVLENQFCASGSASEMWDPDSPTLTSPYDLSDISLVCICECNYLFLIVWFYILLCEMNNQWIINSFIKLADFIGGSCHLFF